MQNIQFYKGVIDATGCISNGWNLLKPNYWLYFGICILATVAMMFLSCIPCLNLLMGGLVNAPLVAGIYYVLLREMRGEPVEFGMMFKGYEKFVPVMVVGFIQSIPGVIFTILQWALDLGRLAAQISSGARRGGGNFYQQGDGTDIAIAGGLLALYIVVGVFFFIFGIAWYITFAFALPLVIEHNISPIEAIKLSARAGWGNVGGLIVLLILSILMILAGVIALCFGVFFVVPLYYAAYAFAYRQVFPMLGQAPQTVPPPGSYGGPFAPQ
jgi:hypothetical protein